MGIFQTLPILKPFSFPVSSNTRYDKGKGRSLVEMQEAMNQIIRTLTPGQENVKGQLLELGERMIKLWDF